MRFALALAIVAFTYPQQQAPATEVFLARLSLDAMPVSGGDVTNISNSAGYDNQPSFLPDGSAVLFSSQRDGKQMDIYRYTIATKTLTQLTHTPEGEYSPLVTPDGKTFSVIRTEADGTQRLWRFDLDETNPRLVLENIKPVGYHVWTDATHLGLFVLGQPATLQIADTTTGAAQVVDSRIGRSLQRNPNNGRVTYVGKPEGGHWIVKEIDPKTREIVTLTETADNNQGEDLVWHPGGWLLMASGTKLMGWKPGQSWTQVGDFSTAGINRITRMAISADRLALVAEPVAK
jgi:dipeptidyl aminopeptidase/acylaminoacyl peptidase